MYKVRSYRSDSRVQGDCDCRPVPVCEDWCKYLRSIGDLKFSRKSVYSLDYIVYSYVHTCVLLYVSCQIGIEITDYTDDKISVGVARPSHVLGQSVPCDRWHSISGTRVQHRCTESEIRAQGLITRVTALQQLMDNIGIRSTQLTLLLMRSMCSWLITPCAAASTQSPY